MVKSVTKRAGYSFFILRLLPLLAAGFVSTVCAETSGYQGRQNAVPAANVANNAVATVSYDKTSDQLSVVANSASLRQVLARIARQSGIEVLFDDMAEETISADIQSEALESGLKRLLNGRNYLMRYSRDEQQKLLLIGVMVLPVGEQDSGRARRLVGLDTEAYDRARSQLSLEQAQRIDVSNERWQARLSELPPESRDKLEKVVEQRLLKQAQYEQRQAEINKKQAQRRAEQQKKMREAEERSLQRLSPDEREAFEQRSRESRERIKAILFSGQN